MAGSLCLPVCFIAVADCLGLIFGYQISTVRTAREAGAQFCTWWD